MRRSVVWLPVLGLLAACAGGGDGLPTATPTETATLAATFTATQTALALTPTHTATTAPTVTATLVPTSSPTASATPPATATASATASSTAPATASITATASATATESASASPTPSATPSATTGPPPTLEPLTIHADAEWIRDAQDRVVILRGANYSGLEFGNFIGRPNGPDESDFAQMKSWGFNVIRLPIAWNYLEPEPNQLNDAHLHDVVDPVVDFAAANDLLVVVEMHQFFWSPCFSNGNGAPAWVCEGHNYSNDFRGAIDAGCDFISGVAAPDGRTLQDHFVDVWTLVGHHFAGDPRVGGINFLNEPHTYGCLTDPETQTHRLYELYRRIRTAMRAQGATQTMFIDPPAIRNLSSPIPTEMLGPDVVYAPHLYTQTFGLPELKYNGDAATITADYTLAATEAAGFGGPLWPGEFGGNTNADGGFREATELFYRDTFDELDRRLIGGAIWAYFPSDNTFSVVDRMGNEKGNLVTAIARPYARRIAGVPTAMRFDTTSKEFTFAWRVDGTAPGNGVSEVFVPQRHYPNGYEAELAPGVTLHPTDDPQIVLLVAPAAGEYSVRFTPTSD